MEEELEEIHIFIKTIKSLPQLLMSGLALTTLHVDPSKGSDLHADCFFMAVWLVCMQMPKLFRKPLTIKWLGAFLVPPSRLNIIESQNLSLSQRAGARETFWVGMEGFRGLAPVNAVQLCFHSATHLGVFTQTVFYLHLRFLNNIAQIIIF